MHAQYIFALQNISWKYENKDMTVQEKALFMNFYRISKLLMSYDLDLWS